MSDDSNSELPSIDEPPSPQGAENPDGSVNVVGKPPRRVTFNSEPELSYYPVPRRTSFASTVAGASERSLPPRFNISHLNTSFSNSSRVRAESLHSPTSPLFDKFLNSNESDETDLEYDSDTATSFASSDDETEVPEVLPEITSVQATLVGNLHHVISSQFVDYGDEDGSTTIELKSVQVEDGNNDDHVFRWMHSEEEVMNFESFTETALQTLKLKVQDKRRVKEKLKAIRKQHEKPFVAQYANHGRNMDPFVFQELRLQPSPAQSHLNRKISIVCFPFFLLEDHIERLRLRSHTSHPPLTLLQSVVSSTEPERDMRQVVCRSAPGQTHRCFYVGQLWSLTLDDDQIVTCARLPEQELGGDIVTIIKEPVRGIPDGPFLTVTDGGNCTWRLRLTECMTWFDFTANFMAIDSSRMDVVRCFEDIFRVTLNGRHVESRNWANVVKRAKQSSVHLVLRKRSQKSRHASMIDDSADENYTSNSVSDEVDEIQPVLGNSVYEKIDGEIIKIWPAKPDAASNDATTFQLDADAGSKAMSISEPGLDDVDWRTTSSGGPSGEDVGGFHALVSLSVSRKAPDISAPETDTSVREDDSRLSRLLENIENKLLLNSTEYEKNAYAQCQPKTLQDATKYLLAETRPKDQEHVRYIPGIPFFVAAVQIFEFFLPLENESAVAKKYWGAIVFAIKNFGSLQDTTKSMNAFKRVAQLTSVLRKELSGPQGPDLATIDIPIEFRKAWIHCVQYLLLFRFKYKSIKARKRHLEKCEALLDHGRTCLWRAAAKVPLLKKEVATPFAVLTGIVSNLVKDINRKGSSVDIVDMYSQYWKRLEAQAKSGRTRTAQQDIIDLQQEIHAVQKTLNHQTTTLKGLFSIVKEQSTGWSEFKSRNLDHVPRIELLILDQCISDVERRIQVFKDITTESTKLENWIVEQRALTKTRQENAIYAFTIVTVVFLPLSFVTSFLGMNTTGIRDMDNGQWVFWASAVPVTFIVVLLALLLTDELRHVWMAVRRFFVSEAKNGRGSRKKEKSYWKLYDEDRANWRDGFRKKGAPNEQLLGGANGDGSVVQGAAVDQWERPYRRTQTFRSME